MDLNTPLTHLYTTKKTVVMKHHQTILLLDPKMAHMSSPHSIFTVICRYILKKSFMHIYICIFICLGFLLIYIYHMKTCIYVNVTIYVFVYSFESAQPPYL